MSAMEMVLSPEQIELQEMMLDFARRQLGELHGDPGANGANGDGRSHFRRDLWQKCADFGVLGLPFPEEFGGSELSLPETVRAMEALGRGCSDHGLLFSIHAHMWAVMMPLLSFGTEEQKSRWLPQLVDGSLIGAHGMSEPDSGTDAYSLTTRAARAGDEYVLNGTKTFVTNAPVADLFVVFATVDAGRGMWGITGFVVERDTPGLQVSPPFHKLGLNGSPMGEVIFDDCHVPAANRLGAEGQGATVFNHSMMWERGCILASQVGRMQQQLDECVRYAKERSQFGRPIGNFQLIAAKLADMKVRLETSRLLLYRAAAQEGGRTAELDAAMAKLYISESAVQSGLDALQIHGGYGYMEEFEAATQLRDALGGTLYSGTSEIQRMVIARHLGLSPA